MGRQAKGKGGGQSKEGLRGIIAQREKSESKSRIRNYKKKKRRGGKRGAILCMPVTLYSTCRRD